MKDQQPTPAELATIAVPLYLHFIAEWREEHEGSRPDAYMDTQIQVRAVEKAKTLWMHARDSGGV